MTLNSGEVGGVREGGVVVSPEMVQCMSEEFNVPYDEAMEWTVEHENTHMKKSDGYAIKIFELQGYTKKNKDILSRYMNFWVTDEIRVMKEAKKFPCSAILDASNLRSTKLMKLKMLDALKMGRLVVLRVRGKECEKNMSLREITRGRKKER